MAKDYIRPEGHNFTIVHKRIRGDRRMWPHFKCSIGDIDGTRIGAIPTPRDYVRYIGRFGTTTQNVMVVVDFDMHFTYASIEQPGSMHDTGVLFHVIEHDTSAFPHPPHGIYFFCFYLLHTVSSLFLHLSIFIYLGKYYMVDAGYPNRFRYLALYKDIGTMLLIGEGVLLLVVNKKHSTIFTQVFVILLSASSEYGR
jgi:hypothetical protein